MASWPWTEYSPDFAQGIPRRSKAFFASTLRRVKIKIYLLIAVAKEGLISVWVEVFQAVKQLNTSWELRLPNTQVNLVQGPLLLLLILTFLTAPKNNDQNYERHEKSSFQLQVVLERENVAEIFQSTDCIEMPCHENII